MNCAGLGSKYFELFLKIDQTVIPVSSAFSASLHWKITLPCSRLMPRCFSYHSYIFSGSSALKKIPPIPVTRGIRPVYSRHGSRHFASGRGNLERVARHHNPRHDVSDNPERNRRDSEHQPHDAHQCHIDAEIAREPGTDSRDLFVVNGPAQSARMRRRTWRRIGIERAPAP